jgi:predicted component of type VI protein secretion system
MLALLMRASPLPLWGFLSLSIDEEALSNGTFMINNAQGIFPEGTMFRAPDSDPLPPPLPLADNFSPVQETLEIQLTLSSKTDSGVCRVVSGRYSTQDAAVAAEIAGGDEIPPYPGGAQSARPGCRLARYSRPRR